MTKLETSSTIRTTKYAQVVHNETTVNGKTMFEVSASTHKGVFISKRITNDRLKSQIWFHEEIKLLSTSPGSTHKNSNYNHFNILAGL